MNATITFGKSINEDVAIRLDGEQIGVIRLSGNRFYTIILEGKGPVGHARSLADAKYVVTHMIGLR